MNVNKNLIDYSNVSKKSLTRFSLDKKQKKKKMSISLGMNMTSKERNNKISNNFNLIDNNNKLIDKKNNNENIQIQKKNNENIQIQQKNNENIQKKKKNIDNTKKKTKNTKILTTKKSIHHSPEVARGQQELHSSIHQQCDRNMDSDVALTQVKWYENNIPDEYGRERRRGGGGQDLNNSSKLNKNNLKIKHTGGKNLNYKKKELFKSSNMVKPQISIKNNNDFNHKKIKFKINKNHYRIINKLYHQNIDNSINQPFYNRLEPVDQYICNILSKDMIINKTSCI